MPVRPRPALGSVTTWSSPQVGPASSFSLASRRSAAQHAEQDAEDFVVTIALAPVVQESASPFVAKRASGRAARDDSFRGGAPCRGACRPATTLPSSKRSTRKASRLSWHPSSRQSATGTPTGERHLATGGGMVSRLANLRAHHVSRLRPALLESRYFPRAPRRASRRRAGRAGCGCPSRSDRRRPRTHGSGEAPFRPGARRRFPGRCGPGGRSRQR